MKTAEDVISNIKQLDEGNDAISKDPNENTRNQKQLQGKTFLYIMSTQYEGNSVGKILAWQKKWREDNKEYLCNPSYYRMPVHDITMAYKSLWEVKPGEQDLVFAGGRTDDDEQLVQKLKGTGQIIVRYSQLDYRAPYSGKSVEELGYSFLADKRLNRIQALIYNDKFLEGLLARDPKLMCEGLASSGIYPTGYLNECCKIKVQETPAKLIEDAKANEEKAIAESQRTYYRSSGQSSGILGFIQSRQY